MTTGAAAERVGLLRRSGVVAISLSLLGIGVLLVVRADMPGTPAFAFPAVLLLPLYVAVAHRPLDYEMRRDSISITLTQLPLALGVLLVAPGIHLLLRLLAVVIDSVVLRRLAPMKVAYNLGGAAFEVGFAATAVAVVAGDGDPGPRLWLALYLGLLLGDLVVHLALHANLALLGRRPALRELLQPLWVILVTSTVFTAVTVVAVSAAWFDPATIVVTVALAGCLALAYRGHRLQSAREHSTERLYAFVKDLGPVDVSTPQALPVLEQIRELLHSRYLDLAVCDPATGSWRHLVVSEPDSEQEQPPSLMSVAEQVASSGAPSLGGRGRSGESQRMATPLIGSEGLLGVLTAEERLGTVRGFDMGDLRLLETTGAELATALDRGRLLADLERAATTDPLTGLPNLDATRRRLDDLMTGSGHRVVVAALAVDSFREVNDTLGHVVGDELLVEVAARLRRAVPDAIVGRIGGGRFVVAVTTVAGPEPAMFCLGLRAQVEGSAQLGPVGTHVRLSVGCAVAPDQGSDAATLVRRAETAMYSARHAGGGPVMWEPAYEVQGQRKLAVVMALRDALAAGGIGVAFQPKLDTVTGQVTGAEALARWAHPALGDIGPDEFVPLAEASGLMSPLTASILRQSLTACREWQQPGGTAVGVAVNVSAVTLLDPGFVTELAAILTSVGVRPELLTLELTEGVLVQDPELAVIRMTELRAVGVRLSVDDFGTGYSSLTYLKGLPVHEVKIDKGFVEGLTSGPADCAVVRGVVDIAHTLGLKVVAEGVEHHDQLTILRRLGVDEVQGFLHASPMPALEAGSWLRAREAPASG